MLSLEPFGGVSVPTLRTVPVTAGVVREAPILAASGTPIDVIAGADTPGIDFALHPGGIISGTVTDHLTGQPVRGELFGWGAQCREGGLHIDVQQEYPLQQHAILQACNKGTGDLTPINLNIIGCLVFTLYPVMPECLL